MTQRSNTVSLEIYPLYSLVQSTLYKQKSKSRYGTWETATVELVLLYLSKSGQS